jgi:hypothetical protein
MMRIASADPEQHYTPQQRRRAKLAFDGHSTFGGHQPDKVFGAMLDSGMYPAFSFLTSEDLRLARKLPELGECL